MKVSLPRASGITNHRWFFFFSGDCAFEALLQLVSETPAHSRVVAGMSKSFLMTNLTIVLAGPVWLAPMYEVRTCARFV